MALPALHTSSVAKKVLSSLAQIWSKLTNWASSLKQDRLSGATPPITDAHAHTTMPADDLHSEAQSAVRSGPANIDSTRHGHGQASRSRRAPMLRQWLDEESGKKDEKMRDRAYYVAKMKDYLHGWDTTWDRLARTKDARKKA